MRFHPPQGPEPLFNPVINLSESPCFTGVSGKSGPESEKLCVGEIRRDKVSKKHLNVKTVNSTRKSNIVG